MPQITTHHDGHGLNDAIMLECDERDPNAGGASHDYTAMLYGDIVLNAQFQHGPRHEAGSKPGITDAVLLAVIKDRYEAFQAGPFSCEENQRVLEHLDAALAEMRARADARASRGVLGKNEK